MTRRYRMTAWTILAVLAVASGAFAQQPGNPYAEVLRYKSDQPRTASAAIEAEIRAAKPDQLRAIEAKLLEILRSPAATSDCKDWVCRQLRQVGSDECVAPVAALLGDKDLATAARWALQSIPGAKVDEALRDALGKVQGSLKAGVLLTVGARRDARAAALVAPLAGDQDAAVAEAALYALGQIGSRDALRSLQEAKVPDGLKRYRSHAILLCAERLAAEGQSVEAAAVYHSVYQQSADAIVKTAALRGIVLTDRAKAGPVLAAALKGDQPRLRAAAAKFACELGGDEILGPVLADLASLPPDMQVTILGLLNDKAALPTALAAAKSSEDGIRVAALDALGRLGDGASVTLLLGVAAADKGEPQAAARKSLQRLGAKEVDPALIAAAQGGELALKAEAMRALAARGTVAGVPMLLKAAEDAQAAVAGEAIDALAMLADAKTLPAMVGLLVKAPSDDRRSAAERAIVVIGRRSEDKPSAADAVLAALPGPSAEVRCSLLRILGRIPCAKAMEALRAAAGDADAAVKDAAVRGLAEWPDPGAMADLLGIARTAPSPVHKVLALRGVVRLAALPSDRPAEQTVQLLADAMALALRAEEKKLVLAALAEVSSPAALELAKGSLANKELEIEAATAVVKIAKGLRDKDPDAAKAAVQEVLRVCQTPAARQLAEGALVVLDTGSNIAPQGVASSPDDLKKDGGAGDDQAAVDGNPATYWDKEDGKSLYRLVVTFKQPEKIAAISVVGYEHHEYAPKDFEILCDGKVVKKIENAQYDKNYLIVKLDEVTCTTVELKISGYYGRSPAIRDLGIYRPVPHK